MRPNKETVKRDMKKKLTQTSIQAEKSEMKELGQNDTEKKKKKEVKKKT